MNNQLSNPFRILWIEDQLLELTAGVDELKQHLFRALNREIEIIQAEWIDKAENELTTLKDTPPDLIILDIMLPRTRANFESKPPLVDINAGFMIWHRLRQQKEWGNKMAEVFIVVVTALSRPLFRPIMESDNKLRWLDKPIGPSTVADEIINCLIPTRNNK